MAEMRERLISASNNDGICSYLVEKENRDSSISVVIYDVRYGRHTEISRIQYKNIGQEYKSPFLNWYNLIFCSNCYGAPPDYEYMHHAVQEGKKTASTVYLNVESEEGKQLVSSLPKCCGSMPYGQSMIYVFRKGCLSQFFDYEQIKSLYKKHGVNSVDWNAVKKYFMKDLSFFGDEQACGFSLQSAGSKEHCIITGLILGYPVESTIALLNK